MLQFVSYQAHVVGSRSGKGQETGETHPFNTPVELTITHKTEFSVEKLKETWKENLKIMLNTMQRAFTGNFIGYTCLFT